MSHYVSVIPKINPSGLHAGLPCTQESQSLLVTYVFLMWNLPVFSIYWFKKIHNDIYTHEFKKHFKMNFYVIKHKTNGINVWCENSHVKEALCLLSLEII